MKSSADTAAASTPLALYKAAKKLDERSGVRACRASSSPASAMRVAPIMSGRGQARQNDRRPAAGSAALRSHGEIVGSAPESIACLSAIKSVECVVLVTSRRGTIRYNITLWTNGIRPALLARGSARGSQPRGWGLPAFVRLKTSSMILRSGIFAAAIVALRAARRLPGCAVTG
jgi:hypothetical protein